MKLYIFLTSSIGRMGGAQMFLSNKCDYFVNRGWSVNAFYTNPFDEIRIKRLESFRPNFLPELRYPVQAYTLKEREHILSKICDGIPAETEVVVETHLTQLAFWGELVAERLNGIHILNYLEEEIPSFSKKEIVFFDFKLRRKECLNASKKSLKRLFKKYYTPEYEKFIFLLKTPCSNVVSEDIDNSIHMKEADYNLVSIGRLDKPYIKNMVKELYALTHSYIDKTFNLIFIGGSPDGSMELEISRIFQNSHNVNLYLLGYIYPIPINVLENINASIASSNSVLVSANLSIPTIAVDANDYQAIGVYGFDTKQTVFRDTEPPRRISEVLSDILFHRKYNCVNNEQLTNSEMETVFSEQEQFLKSTLNVGEYFDVLSIYSNTDILFSVFKRRVRALINILAFKKS